MSKEDGGWIPSVSLYLTTWPSLHSSLPECPPHSGCMALSSLAGACLCQFQYPLHGSLLYDNILLGLSSTKLTYHDLIVQCLLS